MDTKDEKKGLNFLDEVEDESRGSGKTPRIVLLILGVAVIGVVLTFLWGKTRAGLSGTGPQTVETTGAQSSDSQAAVDFAEKFAIMAFNLSYTDINRQQDKVANLMVDNLMADYQQAFLSPKWVNFLRQEKAYVVYQRVDRAGIVKTDTDHYWVKVMGKNIFNSDNSPSFSQVELPMNLMVVVKKENGSFQVSNFQEF